MNEFYEKADKLVRKAVESLISTLGTDGEDISCYNPVALDSAIEDLINARSQMSIGRHAEGQ